MATVIDALLVTLGLDADEFKSGVEKAQSSIEGLVAKLGGFFAVLQSAEAFKSFIADTVSGRAELEDLTSRLNVATEKLQVWQNAAIIATGSAGGMNSSLEALNSKVALLGGPLAQRAVRQFQNFSPTFTEAALKGKDALAVFDMVLATADRMKESGMGQNTIAAKMMRMGISKDVVDMWLDGKEAIESYRERAEALGTTSQESIEAAEKQEQSWNQFNLTMKKARSTIYDMLAPAIKWATDLLNELAAWAKKHPQIVRAAFMGIAAAVGVLTIALIAMSVAAYTNPLVWIITGIAVAVGLVIAGITWLVGKWKAWNDAGRETTTLLGKFFEKVTEVFTAIKNVVVSVFMSIWDMIKDYVQLILDQFELLAALLSGDGDRIEEAFKTLCKHLGEFFNTLFKFILLEAAIALLGLTKLWGKFFDWLEHKARAVGQKMGHWLVQKVGGEDAAKQYDKDMERTNKLKDKMSQFEQMKMNWEYAKSTFALGKDVITGNYQAGMKKYEETNKSIETKIDNIYINAPNATDAPGIAAAAQTAFQAHPMALAQAEGN